MWPHSHTKHYADDICEFQKKDIIYVMGHHGSTVISTNLKMATLERCLGRLLVPCKEKPVILHYIASVHCHS